MLRTYHSATACLTALVGSEQRDTGLLKLVLDLCAAVHGAGNPLDRFADHRDEAAIRSLGLVHEVGDAAVAWDGMSNC